MAKQHMSCQPFILQKPQQQQQQQQQQHPRPVRSPHIPGLYLLVQSSMPLGDRTNLYACRNTAGARKAKFTPLEQQVVELKVGETTAVLPTCAARGMAYCLALTGCPQKRYKGVLLFVECGYKFRFFGDGTYERGELPPKLQPAL